MQAHTKRARVRITRRRGQVRSIAPDRARDEDLHVFLQLSKESLRATGRYIDRMLGRA